MAQRAPLSLFVLAALALQGCGKDVEKTGRVEAQVNPGPATIPVPMASAVPSGVPVYPTTPTVTGGPDTGGPQPDGSCADPIGQIQYPIATFADLTRWNTGRWALDRVVTYTVAQVRPGQHDARTATSAL